MSRGAGTVWRSPGLAFILRAWPGFDGGRSRVVFQPGEFRPARDPQGGKSGRDRGSVAKPGSRANLLCAAMSDAQKTRPAAAAVQVFPEHSPAYFVAEHGNGGFGA